MGFPVFHHSSTLLLRHIRVNRAPHLSVYFYMDDCGLKLECQLSKLPINLFKGLLGSSSTLDNQGSIIYPCVGDCPFSDLRHLNQLQLDCLVLGIILHGEHSQEKNIS